MDKSQITIFYISVNLTITRSQEMSTKCTKYIQSNIRNNKRNIMLYLQENN